MELKQKFRKEVSNLKYQFVDSKCDKVKQLESLNKLNNSLSKKREVLLYNKKTNKKKIKKILKEKKSELKKELCEDLWNELWIDLWIDLWDELWNELGDEEIGGNLWSELLKELRNELGIELWEYHETIFPIAIQRIKPKSKIIIKNKNKIEALKEINNNGIAFIIISKDYLIGIGFDNFKDNILLKKIKEKK